MKNLKLKIAVAAGIAVLALAACKEVQLYGPVEGASVEFDSLQQPGTEFQSMNSTTREEMSDHWGADKWDSWADWAKFVWIGNTSPNTDSMGDNVHYLVTAKYGRDSDASFDHKMDHTDSMGENVHYLVTAKYGGDSDASFDHMMDQYPTSVYGQWHAVAPGHLLKKAAFISVLTEASYQYLISQPDYDQMKGASRSEFAKYVDSKLNEFSQMVVSDVNDDLLVSIDDVLAWSNEYHRGKYLHDQRYLNALADGIAEGASEEEIARLAQQVYEGRFVDSGSRL